jgi:hypothetical protein|tara:strand:- start:1406 stop:1639 length:234 start_codon:yes stop_codon:yes gene_type:complete
LSKIDLQIADTLEFEDGDIAITIKRDGSIGKVILPKMDLKTQQSDGYKAMLEIVELLQPGAKQEFIKHNEKEKGSVH